MEIVNKSGCSLYQGVSPSSQSWLHRLVQVWALLVPTKQNIVSCNGKIKASNWYSTKLLVSQGTLVAVAKWGMWKEGLILNGVVDVFR